MSDLVEWLTNILDEDLARARAAALDMGGGDWSSDGTSVQTASGTHVAGGYGDYCDVGEPVGSFIARHDPASVLADIAAKRAILRIYRQMLEGPMPTSGWLAGQLKAYAYAVGQLASAYADRLGYREEWRP